MSKLDEWGYMISLALANQVGASPQDAVDMTNKKLGITYSPTGDLYLRAKEMMSHFEAWKAAKSARAKLAKKKEIRALIPKLYSDVCPEHQKMLFREVRDICSNRKKKESWDYEIACFYETAEKWLIKTGCSVCPLQKKFD
jgi:hypothetical protein